jgi:hypothetical protein
MLPDWFDAQVAVVVADVPSELENHHHADTATLSAADTVERAVAPVIAVQDPLPERPVGFDKVSPEPVSTSLSVNARYKVLAAGVQRLDTAVVPKLVVITEATEVKSGVVNDSCSIYSASPESKSHSG